MGRYAYERVQLEEWKGNPPAVIDAPDAWMPVNTVDDATEMARRLAERLTGRRYASQGRCAYCHVPHSESVHCQSCGAPR